MIQFTSLLYLLTADNIHFHAPKFFFTVYNFFFSIYCFTFCNLCLHALQKSRKSYKIWFNCFQEFFFFLHPKISLILNYFTVFCYFFLLVLLLSIKRIFYECDMKLFSGHWNKKRIFLCRSSFYCLLFFALHNEWKSIFMCNFFQEMRILDCRWTLSWGHQ